MYRRYGGKAVALRYEPGSYAPYIVARGRGDQAERMLGLAREHRVPVVRETAAAEALVCLDVGSFVPADYWEIVARVLLAVKGMDDEKTVRA